MAYKWLGMRVLEMEEVDALYRTGKLDGCYKLYPDGTEAEINGITLREILDHYRMGGGFGKELPTVELRLPDGKEIRVPEVIDISAIDTFDELGYSLWSVIQEYFAMMGIRTQDDEPDWITVMTVQESILNVLREAGVKFEMN